MRPDALLFRSLCSVAGEVKIIYLKKSECRETRIDDCQSAGLLCGAQTVFFWCLPNSFMVLLARSPLRIPARGIYTHRGGQSQGAAVMKIYFYLIAIGQNFSNVQRLFFGVRLAEFIANILG